MKVIQTRIDGVVIVEPQVYRDQRGYFMESFQDQRYAASGIDVDFVQDNISYSKYGTLRGLHYQHPRAQAKLVQVIRGCIFDVAVDIRCNSPTFGQWVGVELSSDNHRQLYIPQGFAHGFCVLSQEALFIYKCSDYYFPEDEGGIYWNDPDLKIKWPVQDPILSERDQGFSTLKAIPTEQL